MNFVILDKYYSDINSELLFSGDLSFRAFVVGANETVAKDILMELDSRSDGVGYILIVNNDVALPLYRALNYLSSELLQKVVVISTNMKVRNYSRQLGVLNILESVSQLSDLVSENNVSPKSAELTDKYVIVTKGEAVLLNSDRIKYILAEGANSIVCSCDYHAPMRVTMNLKMLAPVYHEKGNFIRLTRSLIVNIELINRIVKRDKSFGMVFFVDGTTLEVNAADRLRLIKVLKQLYTGVSRTSEVFESMADLY